MREERLPLEKEGAGEPPVPVPPVDESWSLMRSVLDVRMPVTKAFYLRPRFWGALAFTAAVTTIVFKTILPHSHRKANISNIVARSPVAARSSNGTATTPDSTSTTRSATGATAPHPTTPLNPTTAPQPAATTQPRTRPSTHPPLIVANSPVLTRARPLRSNAQTSSLPPEGSGARRNRKFPASQDKTVSSTHSGTRTNPGVAPTNLTGIPTSPATTSSPRLTYSPRLSSLTPGVTSTRFHLADSLLRKRSLRPGNPIQKTAASALEHKLRFTAGLTISEQFNFSQQNAAPYTINGTRNILPDYLPSAHLRGYSGDNWDLQIDLSALQPQYTGSRLIDSTGGDSSNLYTFQGYRRYNLYVVKKLFYSDLSVSLHCRLFHGLWLGAGIGYGYLQGAVGDRQVLLAATNPYVPDTMLQSEVVSIKTNDTAYRRLSRSDWRVLFDVEYQWGRATIGLRYGRALNSYLPVQADGSKGTRKNQSLSLRGSFELWRRR